MGTIIFAICASLFTLLCYSLSTSIHSPATGSNAAINSNIIINISNSSGSDGIRTDENRRQLRGWFSSLLWSSKMIDPSTAGKIASGYKNNHPIISDITNEVDLTEPNAAALNPDSQAAKGEGQPADFSLVGTASEGLSDPGNVGQVAEGDLGVPGSHSDASMDAESANEDVEEEEEELGGGIVVRTQPYTGDVDVVITWVNSSDPKWLHDFKRIKVKEYKEFASLYGTREEIQLNLLLLQTHAHTWIRNIFIVSPNHTFSTNFLSPSFAERIKFIPLKTLVPEQFLPTFNSFVIEIYLHKIPGLSEFYVYIHDDLFFMQDINVKHSFYSEKSRSLLLPFDPNDFICKQEFQDMLNLKNPSLYVAQNTVRMFYKKFGKCYDWWAKGLKPYVQNRTINEIVFQKYKNDIFRMSKNKFRKENRNYYRTQNGDFNFLVLSNYYGILTQSMKFTSAYTSDYVSNTKQSNDILNGATGLVAALASSKDKRTHFMTFGNMVHYDDFELYKLCEGIVKDSVDVSYNLDRVTTPKDEIETDLLIKVCGNSPFSGNLKSRYEGPVDVVLTFSHNAPYDLNFSSYYLNVNLLLLNSVVPWIREVVIVHTSLGEGVLTSVLKANAELVNVKFKIRLVNINTFYPNYNLYSKLDIINDRYLLNLGIPFVPELSEVYLFLGNDVSFLRQFDKSEFFKFGYISVAARRSHLGGSCSHFSQTGSPAASILANRSLWTAGNQGGEADHFSQKEKIELVRLGGHSSIDFEVNLTKLNLNSFRIFTRYFPIQPILKDEVKSHETTDQSDELCHFYFDDHPYIQNKTLNHIAANLFKKEIDAYLSSSLAKQQIVTQEFVDSNSFDLFVLSNYLGHYQKVVRFNEHYSVFSKSNQQKSPIKGLGIYDFLSTSGIRFAKAKINGSDDLTGFLCDDAHDALLTAASHNSDIFNPVRRYKESSCPKKEKVHTLLSNLPVDIVITWANSSDGDWVKGLWELYPNFNIINTEVTNEIKLNLLSLQTHAPWVRNIIIYSEHKFNTAFLIPDFRRRIKFVKLSSVMPKSLLPSYNSYAIEASIHKIPGLSEIYFSFSHRLFANALINLNNYISEGVLLIPGSKSNFKCNEDYKVGSPFLQISKNTLDLFVNKTAAECNPWYPIMPYIQNRTINEITYATFKSEVDAMSGIRQRADDKFAKNIINFLALSNFVGVHLKSMAFSDAVKVDWRKDKDVNSAIGSTKYDFIGVGNMRTLSLSNAYTLYKSIASKSCNSTAFRYGNVLNLRDPNFSLKEQSSFTSLPTSINPFRRLTMQGTHQAMGVPVAHTPLSTKTSKINFVGKIPPIVVSAPATVATTSPTETPAQSSVFEECMSISTSAAVKNLAGETKYSGPIDIVITWVDSMNPQWIAEYKRYSKEPFEPERFVSASEIQLNLISLQRNAPWVRFVYIFSLHKFSLYFLTDAFAKKVKFIDQKTVIPRKFLPLYNSNAIEIFIHKIPGLSEIYVYINDDMFFVRPFNVSQKILQNGYIKVPSTKIEQRCDPNYVKYTKFTNKHNFVYTNTEKLYQNKFNKCIPWFAYNHEPYFQNRTIGALTYNLFADDVKRLSNNRFRHNEPLEVGGDFNYMYLSNYVGVHYKSMEFSNSHRSKYATFGPEIQKIWKDASVDFLVMQELFKEAKEQRKELCELIVQSTCSVPSLKAGGDCYRGLALCSQMN